MHERWKRTFYTGGLAQSINFMTLPVIKSLGLLKRSFPMHVLPLHHQVGKETKNCAIHGSPFFWLCLHPRTEGRLCPHKFMQTLSLYSKPRVQSLNVCLFVFQSWKLHFRIDDDFSCCFSISFLSFSFFCFTFCIKFWRLGVCSSFF